MINSFLMTLYGQQGSTPDGIHNPLTQDIVPQDTVRGWLQNVRGTGDSAWQWAVIVTRLVDCSTWAPVITERDTRTTYNLYHLLLSGWNMRPVIDQLLACPPPVQSALFQRRPELAQAFRRDDFAHERAAALVVAIYRESARD